MEKQEKGLHHGLRCIEAYSQSRRSMGIGMSSPWGVVTVIYNSLWHLDSVCCLMLQSGESVVDWHPESCALHHFIKILLFTIFLCWYIVTKSGEHTFYQLEREATVLEDSKTVAWHKRCKPTYHCRESHHEQVQEQGYFMMFWMRLESAYTKPRKNRCTRWRINKPEGDASDATLVKQAQYDYPGCIAYSFITKSI